MPQLFSELNTQHFAGLSLLYLMVYSTYPADQHVLLTRGQSRPEERLPRQLSHSSLTEMAAYQALRLDQGGRQHRPDPPAGHPCRPDPPAGHQLPPLALRPQQDRERRKFVSFTVDLDRTGGPLGISLASKVRLTRGLRSGSGSLLR